MGRRSSGPVARGGEPVELGRYTVTTGERILRGQRVGGLLYVTDRPASGSGRSYLVERGLDPRARSALRALVADYTRQAADLDQVPMAASVVRRTLVSEAVCLRVSQPLV